MRLTFAKTPVVPGEPLTAQAWNNVVDGLFDVAAAISTVETSVSTAQASVTTVQAAVTAVQAALSALNGGTVQVEVTGDPLDVSAARVIATDSRGVRFEAVPPAARMAMVIPAGVDPRTFRVREMPPLPFVFPKLSAGAYRITVSAPGCTDGTGTVTVANDGTASQNPVPVALAFNGQRMPNVLGAKWKDAVGPLQAANPHVLDASGKGVPLTAFDPAYADVSVLMQWPAPDEIVPAGKQPWVVLAMRPPVLVTTPNFVGMTLAQAQTEAAKLGLVIKVV
jgi:hypothetical protein